MSFKIIENLSPKEKERRHQEYTIWLQDNGYMQTEEQKPQGTLADIIDQDKINGAVALTVDGRPYHKAAQELQTMTARRLEVLKEYDKAVKNTHAALQELIVCHNRIDQIINELSRS